LGLTRLPAARAEGARSPNARATRYAAMPSNTCRPSSARRKQVWPSSWARDGGDGCRGHRRRWRCGSGAPGCLHDCGSWAWPARRRRRSA
jgi:hypothetical protein